VTRLPTLFALVMLLWLPARSDAKALHVCATGGSDTVTYAGNSERTPWATIGRAVWGSPNRNTPTAAEAAQAGDVVRVCAGTYAHGGVSTYIDDRAVRYTPLYNPVNEGTNDKPIVIEGTGTVTLALTSGRGPVIGSLSRNYVTWKGFTIDEANAPSRGDTGPVVVAGNETRDVVGVRLEYLTVIGDPKTLPDDNHTGIRLQYTSRVVIANNRIYGFRNGPRNNDANAAGIQLYFSDGTVIEHNHVSDCGSGVFLKAMHSSRAVDQTFDWLPDEGWVVRFNLIENVVNGIAYHVVPAVAEKPAQIYQNVIRNSGTGIRLWTFDVPAKQPRHAKFVNNTLHGNQTAFSIGPAKLVAGAGHTFRNNVVTGGGTAIYTEGETTIGKSEIDFEHNLYDGYETFGVVGDRLSFGTFKSSFKQDAAGRGSLNKDPLFVNARASDLRLKSNSPAVGAGVDMLDLDRDGDKTDSITLGAYITGTEVIGIEPRSGSHP
jgi:hypothetical protein